MNLLDRVFKPFENAISPLELPIQQLPDKGSVQLVWHFLLMFRHVLVVMAVLSTVSSVIRLSPVWVLAYVVDGILDDGAAEFVQHNFGLLVVFACLLVFVDPIVRFIHDCFAVQTTGALLPAAMTWQSHKAVESQDIAFFEDLYAGQVASRIEQVTDSVENQLDLLITDLPRFFILFIGSLGLLLVLAWPLGVVVLVWMLANVWLAYKVIPILMENSKKLASASSRVAGVMTDVYSNIGMVKAFSAESTERDSIRSAIKETIKKQCQLTRFYVLSDFVVHALNGLLVVAMFLVGIWGMIEGFVSVGDFVAAATIMRSLFVASFTFIDLGQSASRSLGTIQDAMPIITAKPGVVDKPDAKAFNYQRGEIEFDDISYAYIDAPKKEHRSRDENNATVFANTTKPVLQRLSLKIKAGEKVGLVGVSGAGKSTLIALLLRLRDVDSGAVRVDGQNVREVRQASLRAEIGVVTQDVYLMNRSMRDNLSYGRPDATDAEIQAAAALADASEFIQELTDGEGRTGLDAHVGDRGVKLSGGQRQRVAIARVILKDARILLLDEATSALDSIAETGIQKNLMRLMENKTTLAIAHRLSTIANMDRLVVLDKGQVIEQGTHDELIQAGGLYAKLWSQQSGGFIPSTLIDSTGF